MKKVQNLTLIAFVLLLMSSCGSTKKITSSQLEERIFSLETNNTALQTEIATLKEEVKNLKKALPSPVEKVIDVGEVPHQGSISPTNTNQPEEQVVDAATAASFQFEELEYDFGTIKEGDKVEHIFKFKNNSSNPLIIENARGSCGCTVPEWSRSPIAPGETSEIKVVFNSKGKKGANTKTITITANTIPANTVLRIMANVEKN